jgi:hypothetical protein
MVAPTVVFLPVLDLCEGSKSLGAHASYAGAVAKCIKDANSNRYRKPMGAARFVGLSPQEALKVLNEGQRYVYVVLEYEVEV